MAINIQVDPKGINLSGSERKEKSKITLELDARSTLDGNFAIFDHHDIDIVVMPKESKVLAMAKEQMSDEVYDSQNRLFEFLTKKGIVLPETVQGGNVYGSLEAKYPQSNDQGIDTFQATILGISKFIDKEKPFFEWQKQTEVEKNNSLLDPSEDESTELGEVPQRQTQGTISKHLGISDYSTFRGY